MPRPDVAYAAQPSYREDFEMKIRKRFMTAWALSFWATLVCAETQDTGNGQQADSSQQVTRDTKTSSTQETKISREEALEIANEIAKTEGYSADFGFVARETLIDKLLKRGIDKSTAQSVEREIFFDYMLADARASASKLADETATSLGGDSSLANREEIANMLLEKGMKTRFNRAIAPALGFFDEIVYRFGNDQHPKIRHIVAQALNHKGEVWIGHMGHEEHERYMAQAFAAFDEVDRRFSKDNDPAIQTEVMDALRNKAQWLGYLKEIPKAIAVYDEIIRRFGTKKPEGVAMALLNKARLLNEQGNTETAIAVYDEIILRFGQGSPIIDRNPRVVVKDFRALLPLPNVAQNIVVEAQLDKAEIRYRQGDTRSAIVIYDQVIQGLDNELGTAHDSDDAYAIARAIINILSRKVKIFDEQKNTEAVIAGYDEIIRRSGKIAPIGQNLRRAENIIRLEGFDWVGAYIPGENRLHLAIAQALLHTHSLDYPTVFNFMESLLAWGKDPATRTGIAMLFLEKGYKLTANQHSDDDEQAEIALYDAVVRFFGEDNAPATRVVVAQALNKKGRRFFWQDKLDARIAIYDEVDHRFGQDEDPYTLEQVADALFHKGEALDELGDAKGAIATLEDIDLRFGKEANANVREKVARALLRKGEILQRQGDNKAAIATYDEIDRRFQTDFNDAIRYIGGRTIQEWGAKALLNKGVILGNQGNHKAAIALYDEIERRFVSLKESFRPTELDEVIIEMFSNKGAILRQQGNYRQAIAAYDEIEQRIKGSCSVDTLEKVAEVFVEKGITQYQQGNIGEAIATYDITMNRFHIFRSYPDTRKPLARALYFKGVALEKQGELQAAIVIYDKIINDFDDGKKGICHHEGSHLTKAKCIAMFDAVQPLVQQAIQARDAARKRLHP
jgi:tetratricopeptide (TPR) repeat protein